MTMLMRKSRREFLASAAAVAAGNAIGAERGPVLAYAGPYSSPVGAEGGPGGSVSAYEIERPNGRLRLMNTVASEGAGPCHLSLHQSGKWALVANYHGGTSAVLPVGVKGELGRATDVKRHEGVLGPRLAASAPRSE